MAPAVVDRHQIRHPPLELLAETAAAIDVDHRLPNRTARVQVGHESFDHLVFVSGFMMRGVHQAHDPGRLIGLEPDLDGSDGFDDRRVAEPQQPASGGRLPRMLCTDPAVMPLHAATPLGFEEAVHDRIGQHPRHRSQAVGIHRLGHQSSGGEANRERSGGSRRDRTGHVGRGQEGRRASGSRSDPTCTAGRPAGVRWSVGHKSARLGIGDAESGAKRGGRHGRRRPVGTAARSWSVPAARLAPRRGCSGRERRRCSCVSTWRSGRVGRPSGACR